MCALYFPRSKPSIVSPDPSEIFIASNDADSTNQAFLASR